VAASCGFALRLAFRTTGFSTFPSEVCRKPENPTGRKRDWRYASVLHFKSGSKVKLLTYPKIALAVDEMLPRASIRRYSIRSTIVST
jgi:hypothetical protein